MTAFLDDDSLDVSALCRTELDGGHWLHLPADTDVVVELSLTGGAGEDGATINTENRAAAGEEQDDDENDECAERPPLDGFFRECSGYALFLFNYLIHIFLYFLS